MRNCIPLWRFLFRHRGSFTPDAPQGSYDKLNEKDMKIAFLAEGIEKRSRTAMIEEREKR